MRNDYSVGGVVVDDHGRIVLIRTRTRGGDTVWGLPKGHPKKGESPAETAKREVEEETGLHVSVVGNAPVGTVEYWFEAKNGEHVHKRVDFYLMRAVGGDPFNHDGEVEEVALLAAAEARSRLSYPNERVMIDNALAN